ncbi:MAG: DnaJ domain-containing protein [Pseudomonadota bacterium]
MSRLFLIIAVAAVFYILLRRIAAMPPHRRRSEYLKLGLGTALVLTVLLALAGKMHWLGAAITGLLVAARQALPVVIRLFPLLSSLGGGSARAAKRSTVTTRFLRMHLDHESGQLSGEVLEGPYQDWKLEDMNREHLEALRDQCQSEDPESLQLLEGYLEQRFGADYDAPEPETPPPPGGMSRQEAYEVLGLDDDADENAITAAHRSLMQKLHPDRGGSDYLAAKINQAKDLLLGR